MLIQMQKIMKEFTKIKKKWLQQKKERNTLEYNETMNLGITFFFSSRQTILRSTYEVIYYSYFKAVKLFSTQF